MKAHPRRDARAGLEITPVEVVAQAAWRGPRRGCMCPRHGAALAFAARWVPGLVRGGCGRGEVARIDRACFADGLWHKAGLMEPVCLAL
jgi:hypothetical protein